MHLSKLVDPASVHVDLVASSKEEMLDALATLMARSPQLAGIDATTLRAALGEREARGTTGFGDGIAIPHCRLPQVSGFAVGLAIAGDGAPFDSLDGKPAQVFVVIVGPEEETHTHVHLLSRVSRALQAPGCLNELRAARHPETARESFLRHARDELPDAPEVPRVLVHVFVQKESCFTDVLESLVALRPTALAVLDATEATDHLHRAPLFSGFLTDRPEVFLKVVVVTLRKDLANEAVRQIGDAAGGLTDEPGVLITVQDLALTVGALRV